MDLDSFGLDEETKASILEKHSEALDSEVKGLKAKVSDLIGRIGKAKSAHEEELIAQTQAVEDAKVAAAEKEGDIAKYKQAAQDREDALNSLKEDFAATKNEYAFAQAKDKFIPKVSDDPAARLYMEQVLKDQIVIADGQVKPKDESLDFEKLVSNIVTDEKYSPYMKANVGSGAGSAGSTGASTSKKFSDMTATEKAIFANQNPKEYARQIGA